MTRKNIAAFGIFPSRESAQKCVSSLLQQGFRNEDISILASNPNTNKELAIEKGTKAPEGVTTGATAGGIVGGAIGLLAGIGTIAIPGVGPFIAAGPIMATLAGIGTGAATGGIIGALAGIGIPEFEAKRYEGQVRDGGILVSVHGDDSDWADKAKRVLEQNGAKDVSSTKEEGIKKAS
jgi:hypothetical protein